MSRSYKKNPIVTDGSARGTKAQKRLANQKVRRTNILLNGGSYKKVFGQWNIHDFSTRWPWNEAKKDYEDGYLQDRFPTLESFYKYWVKCYKCK